MPRISEYQYENDLYEFTVLIFLHSKYIKRAHVNSKFQLDVGSFTLNFIRKLKIPN